MSLLTKVRLYIIYHRKENYVLLILLGFLQPYLPLLFCSYSFIGQPFELKETGQQITYFFSRSSLATFSLILYFLLPIVAIHFGWSELAWFAGAYWNGKHKENFHLAPTMSFGSDCSDSYHFISPYLRKLKVLSMKTCVFCSYSKELKILLFFKQFNLAVIH